MKHTTVGIDIAKRVFQLHWVDVETGEISEKKYRAKDTDTKDFWMPLISSTSFQQWIKENYQVSNGAIISDDDIASELEAIEDVL